MTDLRTHRKQELQSFMCPLPSEDINDETLAGADLVTELLRPSQSGLEPGTAKRHQNGKRRARHSISTGYKEHTKSR